MKTSHTAIALAAWLSFITPLAVQAQAAAPVQHVTLAQAIAIAAAQSPVLAAARDDYRTVQEEVAQARTPALPSIGLSGQNTHGSFAAQSGSASTLLNASIRQLIFDGGRVLAQIHAAQDSADAAGETYQRSAQQLSFNVAQAYYNALEARANVELIQNILKQNIAQEALIRAQMRAGVATRVDLATAHLPTARAQVQLVQAQGQEIAADAAFANQLGLHADAAVAPVDDASASAPSAHSDEPADYESAVKRALLLRPDYLAAERSIAAAQANVQAARRGIAPTVDVITSTGFSSTLVTGGGLQQNNTIGATVSIPIFDQGVTHTQTAQAQIALDRSNALLKEQQLGVEVQVRQALATLTSAQAALAETQSELANAQQVVNDTQDQYRAGVTQLLQLLNAQSGLTQAQNDRLTAVYALRQAEEGYRFALGDL